MSSEDDNLLMREINTLADRAGSNPDKLADLHALATTLGAHFDHRSVKEIQDKLEDTWRTRKLFWVT
ncbi:hypothetical protein HF263_03915 [Rhizobium leguminosarum]|uniref:hypothetical protein n=1 Tax=Rhizobium leguminosarum TaxID=384 RepID=UPI001C926D4A|nr:hypothetical protein [Rhizobium leguminosarum]MBY2993767.1 hypothetical protein [Rhizobium leguminosarum]MBY3055217.1 hypothetical protein [Rhizobium leguminosarum]